MPKRSVPSGNEGGLINEKKKETNKPLRAVHLGRLYGLRKINTFLEALKELKKDGTVQKIVDKYIKAD